MLKDFYDSKKTVIGAGKSIIAFVRKMITIIYHLITHDEEYTDKYGNQQRKDSYRTIRIPIAYSFEEALTLFVETIKKIKKSDPDPF